MMWVAGKQSPIIEQIFYSDLRFINKNTPVNNAPIPNATPPDRPTPDAHRYSATPHQIQGKEPDAGVSFPFRFESWGTL